MAAETLVVSITCGENVHNVNEINNKHVRRDECVRYEPVRQTDKRNIFKQMLRQVVYRYKRFLFLIQTFN